MKARVFGETRKMGFKNSEGFEQAEKKCKTLLKKNESKKKTNRMRYMNKKIFLIGQNDSYWTVLSQKNKLWSNYEGP